MALFLTLRDTQPQNKKSETHSPFWKIITYLRTYLINSFINSFIQYLITYLITYLPTYLPT